MKTHAQKSEAQNAVSNFERGATRTRRHELLALAAMFAMLSAAIGLSSCAGYTTNAAGSTGSQGSTGTGVLSSSTGTVDFGSVAVGSTATQTLTLTDTGTAPVALSGVAVSGAGFSVVGGNYSGTIAAGQSVSVQLEFAPTSGGSLSGSVTVTSDASSAAVASGVTTSPITSETSTKSSFKVNLRGNATEATLSLSPASLNFSNIIVGQSTTRTVTLTNTGTANLQLKSDTVTGTGFSASGLITPQMIAPGQAVSFTVQYAPASAGTVYGSVAFSDNAPLAPQTMALVGTAVVNAGTLSANPTSFNFNGVAVGTSSQQIITLTNSAPGTVTISQVGTSGAGFSTSGISAGQTIASGAQLSFTAFFSPAAVGSASGTITISSNATNPTLSIMLSGTGTQGTLSANPSSVSFGSVLVGSNSSASIILTNSGTAPITLSAASVSGTGFAMSGFTAGTLSAGATTSFTAIFTPTVSGSASGTVSVTSSASGSPLSIALSGTGTQGALSANPSSISFGSVLVGSNGSTSVTLTNSGTATISLSAASVSGTGFAISGFTAGTLNPGATSSFTVTFAPTASGSVTGSVSVTSNAPSSPLKITLTGTGATTLPKLSISTSSVSFSSISVGSSSSQTVTLTNTGTATLNITAASITGSGYTMTLAPTTINAGANTTFSVTFAPTAEGSATGSISITSNASGFPAAIALSGTGLEALGSANPSSVAFGNVVVGNSNSDVITLKNTGNSTLSFSQVSVGGSGFSTSGLTTSSTVAAGGSLNFNAVFSPTSATSSTGSIILTTNGSPAQISISLTGAGTAATKKLNSFSSNLNFGNVQVGKSNSLSTSITNTGNSNVTISGVTVTGTGYTASGITSGLILSPGQSATLSVSFAPTALGSDLGTISIVSDATTSPTISLSGESHTVLLSWTASTTSGVTGYYIYRGTQSGQYTKIDPSSPTSSTQFTDTTVAGGTTYYYVVTAVDSTGVESTYSSPSPASVP